jgi:cytochrome o ubiquinol oxidase subunit 2
MHKKSNPRIWFLALIPLILLVLGLLFVRSSDFAVFDPHGLIAAREKRLLYLTVGLGLLVVVPVFILSYTIAWRYRESNHKARYEPNFDHNVAIETIWWAIPCLIIGVLAVVAWRSSHELDPSRALVSSSKPLTIQVVALEWRWLFIYPEQGLATLNYVELPINRPVTFDITSDAPMNSFWIPRLGGQIYAMAGMTTHLHLIADTPGSYRGSSANISGKGFAGMTFMANAMPQTEFNSWVKSTRNLTSDLDIDEYVRISAPSQDKTLVTYASSAPDLYNRILMKYMMPGTDMHSEVYSVR